MQKEEIREILDRLFVYKNENDEMKYQPEDILTIDDVWLLLDYITNLQEENKRLNNIIDGLEKYLKEQVFNKVGSSVDLAIENHSYCKVLDKLNELKGDNK